MKFKKSEHDKNFYQPVFSSIILLIKDATRDYFLGFDWQKDYKVSQY